MKIGKLDLLWTLFDEVMIPEAVFEGIVQGNVVKYVSAFELEKAVLEQKITVLLIQVGYRISKKLYDSTLERAGE